MDFATLATKFDLPKNSIKAVEHLRKNPDVSATVCGHFGFVVNDTTESIKAAQTAITFINRNGTDDDVSVKVASELEKYRLRISGGLPKPAPVETAPVVAEAVVEAPAVTAEVTSEEVPATVEASPEAVVEAPETVASEGENTETTSEAPAETPPETTEVVKRGRGRPKGSTNKNTVKKVIVATGRGKGRPSNASLGKTTQYQRVIDWVQGSTFKGAEDTSKNRSAMAVAVAVALEMNVGSVNAYISTGFKAGAFA